MGLWQRIKRTFGRHYGYSVLDLERELRGSDTSSGIPVNADTALQVSVAWACVRVLSETIASLPLKLKRRDGDSRMSAEDHPLFGLLADQPNDVMTSFEWRELMQAHLLLRGNAYSYIVRVGQGSRRRIAEILPLHPDYVKVLVGSKATDISYEFHSATGVEKIAPQDMLHIRGLGDNGIVGKTPVEYFRNSIAAALAAERHGAKVFANGARPSGILYAEGNVADDVKARLKEQWQESYGGENAMKTAFLEGGVRFEPLSWKNEDMQYLETRRFQVEEICRWFNVPTVLVQHSDKASTYASAEQFFLSFSKFSVTPWVVRWEKAMKRGLLTEDERKTLYPAFSLAGLERADIKTRYESYAIGRQWGWLTPNAILGKEDENPIPDEQGGNRLLFPSNMADAATFKMPSSDSGGSDAK